MIVVVFGILFGVSVFTATAHGVVIDASNFIDGNNEHSCPGTTGGFGINVRSVYGPGLSVVDSGNVEISNFEIRNICIGILLLRSHDNHIHHNTVHNTSGAAGIIVTGDDGAPAGGSTTGLSTRNLIEYNAVYETSDGMECTNDLAVNCADEFPDCTPPQNFPVLSSGSTWNSSGVNLVGTLSSRPNASFTIEFFANHSLNQAGFGEGELYLGSETVTTDRPAMSHSVSRPRPIRWATGARAPISQLLRPMRVAKRRNLAHTLLDACSMSS